MARNGSGTEIIPNTYNDGDTETAAIFNENFQDIATEITNSLALDGQSVMTGQLKAANGTAAAPGISFGANLNTGIFRKSANVIGLSVNGVEIGSIDSNGLTILGSLTLSSNQLIPSSTVVFTIKSAAPSGWLMFNDGTIGDASSNATFANATAQTIFTDLYNNITDANCPILTSGGGATTRVAQTNAATAWAAHCQITLPITLGRALAAAGAGSGLTSRALGDVVGAETVTLSQGNLPNVTLATAIASGQGSHSHVETTRTGSGGSTQRVPDVQGGSGSTTTADSTSAATLPSMTGTTPLGGSGTAFSNMQPTTFLNAMIKL